MGAATMKWPFSIKRACAAWYARSRRKARTVRRTPLLEMLEDRCMPSSIPLGAVAIDDWTDTDGTTPVRVSVLANDSPSFGAQLLPSSVAIVAAPLHGAATVIPGTGEIQF